MMSGRLVMVSGAAQRWEPHCLPVSEQVKNNALYVHSSYQMPYVQQYTQQTGRHPQSLYITDQEFLDSGSQYFVKFSSKYLL